MGEIQYIPVCEGSRVYKELSARPGAWLVLGAAAPRPEAVAIQEAFTSASLNGTFLFSNPPLKAENKEEAEEIASICETIMKGRRGITWVRSLADGKWEADALLLSPDGTTLSGAFQTQLSCEIYLCVRNGVSVELNQAEGQMLFLDVPPPVSFSNAKYPAAFSDVGVSLCGPFGGVIAFDAVLNSGWLVDLLRCGFDYSYEDGSGALRLITAPLWESLPDTAALHFWVYPANLLSSGARFKENICFQTGFRTLYGEPVWFSSGQEGAMGFLPGHQGDFSNVTVPAGKYGVFTKSGGSIKMLCGLCGTEYFQLEQKTQIEFFPGQPEFSPYFPTKGFSMMDFTKPQPDQVLQARYTTAWARPFGRYYSQPEKAPLFGGKGKLLLPMDVSLPLSEESPCVPVFPYALRLEKPGEAYAEPKEAADFEKQMIAKTRGIRYGGLINDGGLAEGDRVSAEATAATASGFVAGVNAGGGFAYISVAYSQDGNIGFWPPADEVSAAFRNEGMFMVLANPVHAEGFQGRFSMGGWRLCLEIGQGSQYNDYRNILIIKSAKGKLYDPEHPEKSLCADMGRWTEKESLSAPYVDGLPRPEQLANLSGWLLTYCKKGYEKRENRNFADFARAISDEGWQGFLALKLSVSKENVPVYLKGLLTGMKGNEISFHHVGSRITPVKPGDTGPVNDGDSPFFGLIDYMAEGYNGSGALPLKDSSADYGYELLALKVAFENGALKEFSSVSQFVLDRFLGRKPALRSLPYCALLLRGTLQNKNGAPVLSMTSEGGVLEFDGAPFERLEVDSLLMTTADAEGLSCVFSINGGLEWKKPKEGEPDLTSYDRLRFTSYYIRMKGDEFLADESQVMFDMDHSASRPASLCKSLGFSCKAFVQGGAKLQPKDLQYLPLSVDGLEAGALGVNWYGLVLSAVMGSLGTLAGEECVEARILLAWDGESDGLRFAGIHFPGHMMVENIMELNCKNSSLKNQEGHLSLCIGGVTLEILGSLKLPTNGSVNLVLEGGEQGIGWFAGYKK